MQPRSQAHSVSHPDSEPGPQRHGSTAHQHDHAGHDHHDHSHDKPKAGAHKPKHSHGHGHGHHHHDHNASTRALGTALALTLGYSAVEAIMGFWTGSLALLADAGHMVSDAGALGLSLFVARIGQRPRSRNMTYGYRRAEVLGALANAATMLGISVYIAIEAIRRFQAPPALEGDGLLYTAVIGLLLNLVAAYILSRGQGPNLNVRSALLHVLGDALGSVAAITAGICVKLGFPLADPIASFLISVVLGFGSVRLMREASDVLMEATPSEVDVAALERTILETPGVSAVHDLHVWALTPGEPMLTAHVVLTPAAHGTDVAKRVGDRLSYLHGLNHVTIQPEPPAPELVPLRRKKA
jgi:cobalt-zinc-cadmium efflux system protein